MGNRIKGINLILGLALLAGATGSAYEVYQYARISKLNQVLNAGLITANNDYPLQNKFSAAYYQGSAYDFKHAIQTYNQLLEVKTGQSALNHQQQASVLFNIANNLFLSGLNRKVNDDGSLKDEARYDFTQAKTAYEQSLRLAPSKNSAKFNLSLLHSILPQNMKTKTKEQSGMELSNLPIGLP